MGLKGVTMGLKGCVHNLPLPPGQALGMMAGVLLSRFAPVRLPGARAAHRVVGSALFVAGCTLIVWALWERRRQTRGEFDLERPQALVTTGPYALTRHPMYVGWWLIHLGFGVLRGSAWTLATVPSAVIAEHRGVLAEERMLAGAFGDEFRRYQGEVPRYLPDAPAVRRAVTGRAAARG